MNCPFPPDPALLSSAREAAENNSDDAALLEVRELERAHLALPPVVDGARRTRLLHADPISTTWEAWDTTGGQRLFLRCLRPRWRDDPVMFRRMSRAIGRVPPRPNGGISALSWHPDGDWPHIRVIVSGALLADRFPVEDAPITSRMARILAGALRALAHIHSHGAVHGGPMVRFMVEGPDGAEIVWMDMFAAEGAVATDLMDLGRAVSELDPFGIDPVAELAREWADAPPPTAEDGLLLQNKVLGGHLLAARHQLAIAGRRQHQADRTTRLATAVRRLTAAVPPPRVRSCLRASADGVRVLAESDGLAVRGGATVETSDRFLSLVYDPDQGLDAQAARYLLRAWATRESGDATARMEAQAEIGGTDAEAEALVRWLSGMARLRAARLLLEAVHRTRRFAG